MYFSTNVVPRTLHSNSTTYLSTRLPSGDVKPHAVVLKTCMMGVGRLPVCEYNNRCMSYVCLASEGEVHFGMYR